MWAEENRSVALHMFIKMMLTGTHRLKNHGLVMISHQEGRMFLYKTYFTPLQKRLSSLISSTDWKQFLHWSVKKKNLKEVGICLNLEIMTHVSVSRRSVMLLHYQNTSRLIYFSKLSFFPKINLLFGTHSCDSYACLFQVSFWWPSNAISRQTVIQPEHRRRKMSILLQATYLKVDEKNWSGSFR